MNMRFVIVSFACVLSVAPATAHAQSAADLHGTLTTVNAGVDPHISGTLVSYTVRISASDVRVWYFDIATSVNQMVPADPNVSVDQRSDVSGGTIVFERTFFTSTSFYRGIFAFDTNNPSAGAIELDPQPQIRRAAPSIGGRTVAWMEFQGNSSVDSDIFVHDLDTQVTTRLTFTDPSDPSTISNDRDPSVSADGLVVVWSKCELGGITCELWQATRAGAIWTTQRLATGGSVSHLLPTSDGQTVWYSVFNNATGSQNLYSQPVGGGPSVALPLGAGRQSYPHVAGDWVSFDLYDAAENTNDVGVYNRSTGAVWLMPQENAHLESQSLNDISIGADGTIHVVWFQRPDGGTTTDSRIVAYSFSPLTTFTVTALFDQSRSHKRGSVVPIRLQLFDGSNANVSSPALVLTARGLTLKDTASNPLVVEDAGNANPDNAFRYDASLQGYVFNLSTKNLSAGTWELRFTVSGDATVYAVTFAVR